MQAINAILIFELQEDLAHRQAGFPFESFYNASD
jgi:hypothetical protein